MEHRKLGRTALKVSKIGFGAATLGNAYGATDPAQDARAVDVALEQGVNFFDVSPYYGLTLAETRLGTALEGKRDRAVLATKCGRYGMAEFDFSARRVKAGFEESLRRLRTDHVDLLLAHDCEFVPMQQVVEETLPALRELQQQGKARYVGITGYSPGNLRRIAAAFPVDAVLNYCRYSLLNMDLNKALAPFAQEQGIGLINASALHMGLLTPQGGPEWHPAPAEVREAARTMVRMCEERGVDVAQLALRFAVANPYVASTLVGMATEADVLANVRALETPLDEDLVRELQTAVGAALNRSWPSGLPENQS